MSSSCRLEALAVAAGIFALGSASCSGAASQDVFDTFTSTSGGSTSGGASSGGASSGGASSGGPNGSSGSSSACPSEVEPNNDRASANVLMPTRCGTIAPNGESDFLTFQLQDASSSMQIRFDGQVTLTVTVNNETFVLGNGASPKIPFSKGKRYVIEIKQADGAKSPAWRVDLIEK